MCVWRKEAVRPSQQPWQRRTHKEKGGTRVTTWMKTMRIPTYFEIILTLSEQRQPREKDKREEGATESNEKRDIERMDACN